MPLCCPAPSQLLSCRPFPYGDYVSLSARRGWRRRAAAALCVCLPWLDMLGSDAARVRQKSSVVSTAEKGKTVRLIRSRTATFGEQECQVAAAAVVAGTGPGDQGAKPGRKYWEAGKAPALFTETQFWRGNDPSRLLPIGRGASAVRPVGLLAPFSRAKNELQDPATAIAIAKTGFNGPGLGLAGSSFTVPHKVYTVVSHLQFLEVDDDFLTRYGFRR